MPEQVHMKPSDGLCETHDWPTDGMARRLVAAMRDRHGKGGINVCVECVERAKSDAKKAISPAST